MRLLPLAMPLPLRLTANRSQVTADGSELIFVTIDALDKDGHVVANANNRVHFKVTGEGMLAGLDNGDSTDYEPYKGDCRRLFFRKAACNHRTNINCWNDYDHCLLRGTYLCFINRKHNFLQ